MAEERTDIRFGSPELLELNFTNNLEYDQNKYRGFNEPVLNIKKEEGDNNTASVSLEIFIGEKSAKYPFYIHVSMSAEFLWDDSVDNNMKDNLLNTNAPAILYSYIRPIISGVTVASGYPSFDLPFMNFIK